MRRQSGAGMVLWTGASLPNARAAQASRGGVPQIDASRSAAFAVAEL
jgi:hypothetical protein